LCDTISYFPFQIQQHKQQQHLKQQLQLQQQQLQAKEHQLEQLLQSREQLVAKQEQLLILEGVNFSNTLRSVLLFFVFLYFWVVVWYLLRNKQTPFFKIQIRLRQKSA